MEVGLKRLDEPIAVYRHACPNCGRDIDDLRLFYRAPCKSCLRDEDFFELKKMVDESGAGLEDLDLFKTYYERLANREGGLKRLLEEEEALREFEEFFARATKGSRPSSAQKTWARRVLRGVSFTIVAPTGMGKTLFSLVMSLYLVSKNRGYKVVVAFPTVVLLSQSISRVKELAENAGVRLCTEEESAGSDCVRIVYVYGRMGKEERAKAMKAIEEGSFNVLLVTNRFLQDNVEVLSRHKYKLVVMDDVDAVLRSKRSVSTVMRLIGITEDEIEEGIRLVRATQRLARRLSDDERSKLEKEVEELEKKLSEVRRRIDTVLVVNTATGRPRGVYPKLFKVFMGFVAGSRPEALRNIVDTYTVPEESVEEAVIDLASKLGSGGLVFVPVDKGVEYADKLAGLLRERGVKAESFHSKRPPRILSEFERGDVDVLVGVAVYYGTLVRGLDMPARVRYAVFAGVPRHKFSSKLEDVSPIDLLRLIAALLEVVEGDEKRDLEKIFGRLSSRFRRLSGAALFRVREDFRKKLSGEQVEETPLLRDLTTALEYARRLLSREDVRSKLSSVGEVALVTEDGQQYIMIPDYTTYIQASGRTSRLYPGGLTKGLSVLVVDDVRLLRGLARRLRWVLEDFQFKDLKDVDLDAVVSEIDRDREEVLRVMKGEVKESKVHQLVKSTLLIVESPNKARTIARFFGRPSIRILGKGLLAYEVATGNYILTIVASGGHVYDLVASKNRDLIFEKLAGRDVDDESVYGILRDGSKFIPIYTDIKKCEDGRQFTDEPQEQALCDKIALRKLEVINVLRELAREVDLVLVGTDPDTEGEKIAWDLTVLLRPYNRNIKRIRFHEVTKRAILNAIANPEDIDLNMVKAQIVRRLDDRWVGFTLSAILQKYLWVQYCYEEMHNPKRGIKSVRDCCRPNYNWSAGRVQSPVLMYILEGVMKKSKLRGYRLSVILSHNGVEKRVEIPLKKRGFPGILRELSKRELGSRDPKVASKRVRDKLSKSFINNVEVRLVKLRHDEREVDPPPPFTTDTLLAEASRTLGFTASLAMNIAQELFEVGLITYHRTDSTRVSDAGLAVARQYIEEKYGDTALFKPRQWGTGGAHECIRPTRPIDAERLRELVREGVLDFPIQLRREHYQLYDLIFRRFIASQMKAAKVLAEKYELEFCLKDGAEGECAKKASLEQTDYVDVVESGFLDMYKPFTVDPKNRLPEVETPVKLVVKDVVFIQPPLPKTHEVVSWMKEKGIGRPSTYAKILSTLVERGYVIIRENRLIVAKKGKMVAEFLFKELFPHNASGRTSWTKTPMIGVEATRLLESKMDDVATGKEDYSSVLNAIYSELHSLVLNNDELLSKLRDRYSFYCGRES
ncbi:reverse gyrase [Thermogladius sp.]|uniref:reverse gyrase n=1 Tax=Thermogladius sp. TaxID=2023064 RepID=UPI003D0CBFF3